MFEPSYHRGLSRLCIKRDLEAQGPNFPFLVLGGVLERSEYSWLTKSQEATPHPTRGTAYTTQDGRHNGSERIHIQHILKNRAEPHIHEFVQTKQVQAKLSRCNHVIAGRGLNNPAHEGTTRVH